MLFDMIINAGTNNENTEKSFMRNVKTPIQYHLEKGLVFLFCFNSWRLRLFGQQSDQCVQFLQCQKVGAFPETN